MKAGDLVVLGGGGHARVVAEAARLAGWRVLGCLAPEAGAGLERLGDDDDLPAVLARTGASLILGLGSRPRRRELGEQHRERRWASIVHPAAVVSPDAALAPGCFVAARAVVHCGARIGAHAVINTGAVVEHDCVLGDHVQLAPGAVLGGGVSAGAGVFVGLGAGIRDGIAIGAGATVGMGAAVVCEVRAGATVMGVPARERG